MNTERIFISDLYENKLPIKVSRYFLELCSEASLPRRSASRSIPKPRGWNLFVCCFNCLEIISNSILYENLYVELLQIHTPWAIDFVLISYIAQLKF